MTAKMQPAVVLGMLRPPAERLTAAQARTWLEVDLPAILALAAELAPSWDPAVREPLATLLWDALALVRSAVAALRDSPTAPLQLDRETPADAGARRRALAALVAALGEADIVSEASLGKGLRLLAQQLRG